MKFLLHLFISVCVCVYGCVLSWVCKAQGTACRKLSPSPFWVLVIEFRSPNLMQALIPTDPSCWPSILFDSGFLSDGILLHVLGWPETYCIAQAVLEPRIFLPQPPNGKLLNELNFNFGDRVSCSPLWLRVPLTNLEWPWTYPPSSTSPGLELAGVCHHLCIKGPGPWNWTTSPAL